MNRIMRASRKVRLARERGQMVLIFALIIIPVTMLVGAVAVDASVWQSERRGSQKDADLAALAGAYELIAPTQSQAAAQAAAVSNAATNDEAGNASLIAPPAVDNSCFHTPVLDSVTVNVRHASRSFFAGALQTLTGGAVSAAPDVGAHARACMGSPAEGRGILPLGVQVTGFNSDCFQPDPANPGGSEVPVFGQYCQLAFAGADLASGEGGFLKLYNDGLSTCSQPNTGGGNTLNNEISSGGANTTCWVAPPGTTSADCAGPPPATWPFPYVNYCVWPKTQTFNNPTQQAFKDLIAGEGACDAASVGQPWHTANSPSAIDDWLEVVEATNGDPNPAPGTTTFARRACTSPRLVTLLIIKQFDASGNQPNPILAFASFYIDGCKYNGVLSPKCIPPGGSIGQASLYGFFMNILDIGTIGAPNQYGQRTIALSE